MIAQEAPLAFYIELYLRRERIAWLCVLFSAGYDPF